jgi:hypothetical protein
MNQGRKRGGGNSRRGRAARRELRAPKWKVHTPNLLKEILTNPSCAALVVPIRIFGDLLGKVAARAIALEDPELNRLMMRLTLYEQADPESPGFDRKLFEEMTS